MHTVPALASMSQPSGVDFRWCMIPARLKLILCRAVMEYVTMLWVADTLMNVLEVSELQYNITSVLDGRLNITNYCDSSFGPTRDITSIYL